MATPVVAAYAFALGFELWRAAPRFRWIARPAAILLGLHGGIFAARFFAVLIGGDSFLEAGASIAAPLSPLAILEMIIVAIALAFLLLSAAKEEIGMRHREAALLDPLTGIANRRGFDIEAERVFADARRTSAPMGLLLFDLDNFKEINDGFGHPAGDRILRTLGRTVSAYLRPGDVLGRLGGDEFAIVLSNTRLEQALVLAERVRRTVAAMVVRTDPTIRLTASIGVAGTGAPQSLEALFEDADAALYRAKANGRNRMEHAPARDTRSERPSVSFTRPAMQRVA
jgi:diguanylate cyclase (GGDEF)-like protein